MKTHILIVEDEPGIAELLRFTLHTAGFSYDIVGSAKEARQASITRLPQLVLLDWMLPDHSGLTLLQEWRNQPRSANLAVIMLTAKGTDEDKVKGLNTGADDYVTKPFSPKELIARIHAVLRRKLPELNQGIVSYGAIQIDVPNYEMTINGQKIELGPIEFKLLRFFMAHPEQIFSRSQLLDKIWGDQHFIEERTVDVHIMRLRKSLDIAAHYIKTVRGIGYKFKK